MNESVTEKDVVLVVDDTPSNLDVMSAFLDGAGLEVLVAQDGESAIQKVNYVIPDLILLDVMMPGIDGFETCERLKENESIRDIPIIFMTALADTSYKVKGLKLGAVDYITKPFQKQEVLARIKLHLQLRRLAKTLEYKNQRLLQEIEEHTKARTALQQLTHALEERVEQRTAELSQTLDELHESQEKLRYDATHDSLTGLPNRAWLIERLKKLIEENINYAVLFVDLDRFKVVNDSLGHIVGDELLKCVASRMQACLASPNTVTRVGGDEFIVLLETGNASEIAQKLLDQLSLPFNFNGYEVVMEASIGITFSTMGYQEPMDAIRDADIAMYRAKEDGKGGYQVFDPEMQLSAIARMQLEHDLRKAITAEQEFELHYQAIICLTTGKIKGFEALLRWNHPQKRISPVQFIPIAEETGLINPLGWWIFREACRQLRRWHEQFPNIPLSLNINFSAVQFQQINYLERIAEILQETGVMKDAVKIEITESCLFNTPIEDLKLLRNLGLGLCIDDFGTGYSSLSRLHEFPISTLKIDRAFVNRLNPDTDDTAIIQIILLLARNLGLEVVAEGIETQFQLEKLRQFGCGSGQGYFFSKPLDSQRATQLIMNGVAL